MARCPTPFHSLLSTIYQFLSHPSGRNHDQAIDRLNWIGVSRLSLGLGVLLVGLTFLSPQMAIGEQNQTDAARDMELGTQKLNQSKFPQAAQHWMEASKKFEANGQVNEQTKALFNLARALQKTGSLRQSAATLQVALGLSKTIEDKSMTARVLEELGNVHLQLGYKKEAVKFVQEGLALARKEQLPSVEAGLLNTMGNILTKLNQSMQAIGAYTESAILAQGTGNQDLEITALINSVQAARQQGLGVNAEDRLDLAMAKIESSPSTHRKVNALLTAGLFYQDMNNEIKIPRPTITHQPQPQSGSRGGRGIEVQPGSAPPELSETIVIPESLLNPTTELPPDSFLPPNMGSDNKGKSLRFRAHNAYSKAAELAGQIGDMRGEAYSWGLLGNLYEEGDQYPEALELTRRAMGISNQANSFDSQYRWHWQFGRIYRALGNFEKSQKAYQRAMYSVQTIRNEISVAYQHRQQSYRDGVGALYFELADLLFERAKSSTNEEKGHQYLVEARNAVEAFKAGELQDYFKDECVQTALKGSKTIETVGTKTAIIYPIMLKDRLELLVNFPKGLKNYTISIGEQDMIKEIRTFRQNLQNPETNAYLPQAQQLYDWLFRHIEQDLTNEAIHTVVIVPDGALRTIPLAALHDGTQHVIEKFAFATTPGMTLTDPRPINRDNINLISLGLTEAVQGFPPLPFVKKELETLHNLYGGKLLLNQEFTEAKMQKELEEGEFSIVHIASHALMETKIEDTFVLAYNEKITMDRLGEMIGLFRFRKTPLDLLTLSACETAAGDDKAALGLAGVAVKAGARSALATLWAIDDQVASDLVSDFYGKLQNSSLSKAQALQQAQIKVLENQEHQHPNFWSPFLLINNWL